MPTVRLLCPRVGRKSHGAGSRMLAEPPGIAKRIPRESVARVGDIQGLPGHGPPGHGGSAALPPTYTVL